MLNIVLCFLLPWVAMLLRGKVLQGILCLILQITVLGWIPATIWALYVTRDETTA